MTYLKRCAWAVAIAAVATGGVTAQTTGGGQTTGTPSGLGANTGLGGNGQGGNNSPQNTAAQAPTISGTSGGFSQSAVMSSNIISGYFANPMYQGLPSSSANGTAITGPGGFGSVLFSGTGSGAGGTGGRATASRSGTGGLGGTMGGGRTSTGLGSTGGLGSTSGLGGSTLGSPTSGLGGSTGLGGTGRTGGLGSTGGLGATGGLGGTGRTGGFGGTTGFGSTGFGNTGMNSTNQQLSTGRQVAYTQTIKFNIAPITIPQMQADMQSLIATSPTLSSVNGLKAVVIDGGVVVLRGAVADEDEARLVEGMFSLAPGVKGVVNELQFPKP